METQKIINVLDKGFVKLVDIMPSKFDCPVLKADEAIVQSARVSYDQESKGPEQDAKLVKYLIKHSHWTPVEHVVYKFHIKCPIFVQRHIVKHRMTTMNEVSARYTEVKDDWYVPTKFRTQSKSNRQASGPDLEDTEIVNQYNNFSGHIYEFYKMLISKGVAREMARTILPQNMYTSFYWKIDLRNLLHFCNLRNSSDAQWETQEYAKALEQIVSEYNPISYKTYREMHPIT